MIGMVLVLLLVVAAVVAIWRFAPVATLVKVALSIAVVVLVAVAMPLVAAGHSGNHSSVTQH